MNSARKLLVIVISVALICSLVELYFFLVLPLYVIRNGNFDEGITNWSILTYYGNNSFNVSLNIANDFHSSIFYGGKLTIIRNNTYWLPDKDNIWFKIFQNISAHPVTETTMVSFRLFIAQSDLDLLVKQSDAVFIYVGFMLSNHVENHFCVYGWVINNSGKIEIKPEMFRELKYWTILNLKEEEINLTDGFELFFEKNVWLDIMGKGIPIDSSWQIMEGAELGFMIWNLSLNETQNLTVKLNHFDITYNWPVFPLTWKPGNIAP